MLDEIDEGPPISDGALLAKDPGTDPVWFIDHSLQQKRHISDVAMDKYNFSWDRIEAVSNFVLDAIPTGSDIL